MIRSSGSSSSRIETLTSKKWKWEAEELSFGPLLSGKPHKGARRSEGVNCPARPRPPLPLGIPPRNSHPENPSPVCWVSLTAVSNCSFLGSCSKSLHWHKLRKALKWLIMSDQIPLSLRKLPGFCVRRQGGKSLFLLYHHIHSLSIIQMIFVLIFPPLLSELYHDGRDDERNQTLARWLSLSQRHLSFLQSNYIQ